jgi:sugar phosphate isomerase/epimerase
MARLALVPRQRKDDAMPSGDGTRREFFCTAALAAGAAALTAYGAEPVQRKGPPGLKLSIAAYSYRKFLSGKEPSMTLDDFLHKGAELGLDAVEPTSYYFRDTSTRYLRHLRSTAFRLGLDISGTAIGNDFGHPPGAARDGQIAHTKKWIEHAETLGAPVIRIFAGHQKKGQTAEECHKLMVAGMEETCAYAGERGVYLALENHGGPTATAEGLLKLVKDVKSPWLGVNLDTGNFRSEDPYRDMAAAAPYTLNVQVKVDVRVGGKSQPTDYKRVVTILRDAGYRGYVALEYEAAEDPMTAIPGHIAALREAIAAG